MKKYSIVLSILFLITSISHGEDKDIIEMQKNTFKEIVKISKCCSSIKLYYSDDEVKRELELKNNDKERIANLLTTVSYKKPLINKGVHVYPSYSLSLNIISKKEGEYSIDITPMGDIPEYMPIDLSEDRKKTIKEIIKPYIKLILSK